MQSRVVLSGQVKQYFACESQHQQGAFFHMTGGFYDFFKMSNPLTEFQGSFFFYLYLYLGRWFNLTGIFFKRIEVTT